VFGRTTTTQAKGRAAEQRVAKAAKRRGWTQVAANFTVRGGELDLVYRADEWLVVVEVRYRSRSDYGGAAGSVTQTKQRRIILATRHLLAQNPCYAELPIRFDVVGVDDSNQLDWIENAFLAE